MGQARKTQAGGTSAPDAPGTVLDGSKPLDNMRWERFCQLYAGKHFANGRQAYREAGYSPKSDQSADVEASRLLRNDKVWERITHLRQESVRLLGLDRTHILKTRLQCLNDKNTPWPDRLKAADAIEKSMGWNEADKHDVKVTGAITTIVFSETLDDEEYLN